ncbi:MAG: ThiF family adenylyltransferase [Actinomycetes bacterium]
MRPLLKPALRRVWRDASTLQLGLDPGSAVLIGGLDAASARLVESLDGTRDVPGVLRAAARLGLDPQHADRLLDLLARSGVLDDGAADRGSLATLSQAERERLGPDLAAASIVHRDPGGGAGVLARRRAAVVGVHGAGRVGASLTTLLAAAGIGALLVADTVTTRIDDTAPAGLSADDVGAHRQDAALRAARRLSPGLRRRLPAGRTRPDLAVVASAADHALPDRMVRRGVPHLFALVREGTGLVGPLVLPGRSSCHRCHDLRRTDVDPSWPSVAAQLTGAVDELPAPCDVVLATAVAAHAAMQVLAFVDAGPDGPPPPTVDGTIEIGQADGRVRRRSWAVHPLCGCGWPAA